MENIKKIYTRINNLLSPVSILLYACGSALTQSAIQLNKKDENEQTVQILLISSNIAYLVGYLLNTRIKIKERVEEIKKPVIIDETLQMSSLAQTIPQTIPTNTPYQEKYYANPPTPHRNNQPSNMEPIEINNIRLAPRNSEYYSNGPNFSEV